MTKNITYQVFDQIFDLPDHLIPVLKRLSNGDWGIMRPWLTERTSRPCLALWDNDSPDWGEFQTFHNIVVAFDKKTPVGWAMKDENGMINIFVKKSYRSGGIAHTLAYIWLKRMVKNNQIRSNGWSSQFNVWGIDYKKGSSWTHNAEAASIANHVIPKVLKFKKKKNNFKHVVPRI